MFRQCVPLVMRAYLAQLRLLAGLSGVGKRQYIGEISNTVDFANMASFLSPFPPTKLRLVPERAELGISSF